MANIDIRTNDDAFDSDAIEVSTPHPHSPNTFGSAVRPSATIEEYLMALVAENFLEPEKPGQQYHVVLARTNVVLPRAMTLADAGVRSGDVLEVSVTGTAGAGGV